MSYLFKPTPRQRRNLLTLAGYLERLSPRYKHFNMRTYADAEDLDSDTAQEMIADYALRNGGVNRIHCGAVACAVGHGPAAGILVPKSFVKKDDWGDLDVDWNGYAENFIGKWQIDDDRRAVWQFLFGSDWENVDGHHYGAAARIRYLLDGNPLPEDWTYLTSPEAEHVKLYRPYRQARSAWKAPAKTKDVAHV